MTWEGPFQCVLILPLFIALYTFLSHMIFNCLSGYLFAVEDSRS